jgi:hypothetical protein
MGSLAAAETHFNLYLVALFEEAPCRANADLQIVLVGTGAQADLLDFRDVLVLLCVTRTLALLEPESSQVRDATHRRIRGGCNFDQVEAGSLGAAKRLVNGDDTNLLTLFIDDANFWDADLAIGSWTGWDRWTCVKWSTGYGPFPPYFFFGPLLAIGAFGTALALLPPFFDMAYLLFGSGWRTGRAPTKREAASGVAIASEVEHALRQCRRQPSVDNQHRHVVAPNDRVARVRDVNRHSQAPDLIQAQSHALLRPRKMFRQQPAELRACSLGQLNHAAGPFRRVQSPAPARESVADSLSGRVEAFVSSGPARRTDYRRIDRRYRGASRNTSSSTRACRRWVGTAPGPPGRSSSMSR